MKKLLILSLVFQILQATTSFSLALMHNDFLGKWKIIKADIDGVVYKIADKNAFLFFKQKKFLGNVGCNDFFGNYDVMEQQKIIIAPNNATNKTCNIKTLELETKFLRYFMGNFTIEKEGKIFVLQNARLKIYLKALK